MAKYAVMTTGDPIKGASTEGALYNTNQPFKSGLDIRDRLAELITSGGNLSTEDKSNVYSDLSKMVGEPLAQKLIVQAHMHGQRPDTKKLTNNEAKIQSFYDIGSNDPEVQGVLSKIKSMGYGVVPGYRESTSSILQKQAGRTTGTDGGPISDVAKRILLKVKK